MGIINLTPDSFHDGGTLGSTSAAVDRAGAMLADGAAILDLGAYSSRPGATDISPDEECDRLLPTLTATRAAFPEAFISVDTFRSGVASAALECGADMINDISGGALDLELPRVASASNAPYIAMHMRGTPQTMQHGLTEGPILSDVLRHFSIRLERLKAAGLHDIILDPGLGFAKNSDHNWAVLEGLAHLTTLGCRLLVGASRKRFLGEVLPEGHHVTERDAVSASVGVSLADRGVWGLRVHNPLIHTQALDVWQAVREGRRP
jgi:dihydropteroate synthase